MSTPTPVPGVSYLGVWSTAAGPVWVMFHESIQHPGYRHIQLMDCRPADGGWLAGFSRPVREDCAAELLAEFLAAEFIPAEAIDWLSVESLGGDFGADVNAALLRDSETHWWRHRPQAKRRKVAQ